MTSRISVSLGDIAAKVDYGVTTSARNQPIGPKFLRITDIQDGQVDWANVPWCKCDPRESASSRLSRGDIVFARTGATTGKSFLIRDCPQDAVFASYLIRVRAGGDVDATYLSHYFQTPDYWAQIHNAARGAAQPGVNATVLKRLLIPLPPLAEQRRIADILDRADALRTKRRATLSRLDALGQSFFFRMFGDPLSSNHEGQPLQDIAEVIMGQSPPGHSYNSKGIGAPLLNGPTEFGQRNPIARQWTTEPVRMCAPGDLLFCVRGATAGRLNRADNAYCLGRGVAAIRPRVAELSEFLFAVLDRLYPYFQSRGVGTTFINISRADLRMLPIPAADPIRVRRLQAEGASTYRLKALFENSLAQLDALFASLQHCAFRGEL